MLSKSSECRNCILVIILLYVIRCEGWKAVPANQAVYAMRSLVSQFDEEDDGGWGQGGTVVAGEKIPDELLPRSYLHSNYKFGWCSPDSTSKHFLRKTVNMTLASFRDTKLRYIYLLEHKHTQRIKLQCIMMKLYTPRKYLFRKSRMPMYYCQGQVHFVMLNTIQKIELHEFYMQQLLLTPVNFIFEFYHAPPL